MLIVITRPDFFPGEAQAIIRLFEERKIDRLHLRKPGAPPSDVERLIRDIPPKYYTRISIHDFHDLAIRYSLGGIHLTGRTPSAPPDWQGLLSTSCHTLDELAEKNLENRYAYLSLSPIFDSISKQGYTSRFTTQEISQAHAQGIINSRTLALGGITFDRIPQILSLGFGGAMILGDAWK